MTNKNNANNILTGDTLLYDESKYTLSKNPVSKENKKKINNPFFGGILLCDNSKYTLSEDPGLIDNYKEFLNDYLSGAEFPVVIDEILNALDLNVSEFYITGNIIYNERQENGSWIKEEINPISNPGWFNECPRLGNIGFKISDGYNFDSYYAIQISSDQGGVKLYRGQVGFEGMETLINSYHIDCTVGEFGPRIKPVESGSAANKK